jgi:hypothetical protein
MRSAHIDWWKRFHERCRREADGRLVCTGLSLVEAEQLLDWLDSLGVVEREVTLDASGATVRWRE